MVRFHDYPEDVWVEIMSWLPPESLKRFKRVCKSWNVLINTLIGDREFVAKHLRNMKTKSVSSPNLCFRDLYAVSSPDFEEGASSDRAYLLSVIDGEDCDSRDYIPCGDEGFDFLYGDKYDNEFGFVSQCNGVICFREYDSNGQDYIFLVNPSLREVKVIPNPFPYYDDDGENALAGVGFGYDSRADDYKVVVITFKWLNSFNAAVYSLRTNTWKKINCDLKHIYMFLYDSQSVYCNGVCYWLLHVEDCNIGSFDLHGEVFHVIPHPGVVSNLVHIFNKIAVWNDSLALFSYTEVDMLAINMWVLDSNYVKGSYTWTKHMTIGPLPYICHPQAFMLDGELLLLEMEDNRTMVTYNLRTRELGGYSKHLEGSGTQLVPSTKSLVSVLKNRG